MYCRYCGEENPEEAEYCKNCGKRLKEEIKKPKLIEAPKREYKQKTQRTTTTTDRSTNDSSDWIGCCMYLIAIFIIFAIIGAF